MRNYFVDGGWNAICDRCGLKHKDTELRKEWTGLLVCTPCYEPRHPQTLLRVPEEHNNPEWARPEPADTFITVPYIASNVGKQS